MQRRSLLKALTALPMIPLLDGARAVEVPKGRYVIFVDASSRNVEALISGNIENHPLAGSPIHALDVRAGETLEDAIKIYKIED